MPYSVPYTNVGNRPAPPLDKKSHDAKRPAFQASVSQPMELHRERTVGARSFARHCQRSWHVLARGCAVGLTYRDPFP